ncbi:MAG: hypothetical protein QOF35_1947, partial [Actinomycetota bacterium]|nr:hypothetical protein [Actinomycetota bacterium]
MKTAGHQWEGQTPQSSGPARVKLSVVAVDRGEMSQRVLCGTSTCHVSDRIKAEQLGNAQTVRL